MKKLNENVTKLLEETKAWILATCGDGPNAVAVFFTEVEDGRLVVYDVFMKKTLANLAQNNKVAITVYSDQTLEGYQIKGTAAYSTDAALLEKGNAMASKFNLTVKGALLVDADQVYVLTPGPSNGQML